MFSLVTKYVRKTFAAEICDETKSPHLAMKIELSMTDESTHQLDQTIVDVARPLCHTKIALQSPFHSQEEEVQKDDTITMSSSPPTVSS
jgi:hypothetical protein